MYKFIAFLLVIFGPPIFVYLGYLFATWGSGWYPGDWSVETRGTVIVCFAVYAMFITVSVASTL